MDLKHINDALSEKNPREIVQWALALKKRSVVTTNFRPYEAAILHAVVSEAPEISVIWCDTGYNTPQTYRHAHELIELLRLNIDVYLPRHSAAYRDVYMGIPGIDSPLHPTFTQEVKLEPFERAMAHHAPEVWFTNLRKDQTEFRANLDIVSLSKDGVIKVSPFFHYSEDELDRYLEMHGLPNEHRYFDPTKALSNRECGLHTL